MVCTYDNWLALMNSLIGSRLNTEGQLGRLCGRLVLSLCLGRQVHANVLHQPLLRFRTCQLQTTGISLLPRRARRHCQLIRGCSLPSHVLGCILPIFSPFFPVFCAFSPSCRDGSNEPQAGTQGQETAGTPARRLILAVRRGWEAD